MIKDDELNKILDLNKDLAQLAKFYTQEASTIKELKEKCELFLAQKTLASLKQNVKF